MLALQKPALSRKVREEDLCLSVTGEENLLDFCLSGDLKGASWLILAIKVAFLSWKIWAGLKGHRNRKPAFSAPFPHFPT